MLPQITIPLRHPISDPSYWVWLIVIYYIPTTGLSRVLYISYSDRRISELKEKAILNRYICFRDQLRKL